MITRTHALSVAAVLLAMVAARAAWIGPVNPDTDTFVDYALAGPTDNAKIVYSGTTSFTGKTVNSLWIVNEGAGNNTITLNGTLTVTSGALFFTGTWTTLGQSSSTINFNGQPGYINLRPNIAQMQIQPALVNTSATAGLSTSGNGRYVSTTSTYQGPTTVYDGFFLDILPTSSSPLRLLPGASYVPAQARQLIPSVEGSGTIGSTTSGRSTHIGTLDAAMPLNSILLNGGSITPGAWDGWTGAPFSSATISTQWTAGATYPATLELRDGALNITLAGTAAGQYGVLRATNQADAGLTVKINPAAALLNVSLDYVPSLGDTFVVLANEGANPIQGYFGGLSEGAEFLLSSSLDSSSFYQFRISYLGGTGNDVALTMNEVIPIPEPASVILLALAGLVGCRRRRPTPLHQRRGALACQPGRRQARLAAVATAMAMVVAVTVLGLLPPPAGAAVYTNTAAGGNWDSAASWTAGSGYPGSGDTLALSGTGTITVNGNQQFGATSGSSNSSWTTFSTVAFGSGALLTHNSGDTFSYAQAGTGNFLLSGGGTFLNLGNLQNDGSYGRLLGLRSGLTLENRGALTFNGNSTSMNIDGTSKLFNNDGTIRVTANYRGYIGATAAGAQFTTYDTASSTLKGLALDIGSGARLGLGYYYNDLTQTLAGTVKIASLSMGSSASRLEFGNVNMTLATSVTDTLTGAGVLSVGGIADGTASQSTLTLGNSQTWAFAGGVSLASSSTGTTLKLAGHTLTVPTSLTTSGGSNVYLDGGAGGRLVVPAGGSVAIGQGWRGLVATNGATIENRGTFTFGITDGNPDAISLDGTSTFSNNGGTLNVIRTAGIGASADGGVFTNYDSVAGVFRDLTLNITNNKSFSLGAAVIGGGYMPMDKRLDGRVSFTGLNIDPGSTLQIGRYSNLSFRGDFTAAGAFTLDASSTFAVEDNVTIAMGQGMTWGSATIATNGHTVTLTSNVTHTGGGDNTVSGNGSAGRLINHGAYASNVEWRGLNLTGSVVFENCGSFTHTRRDDATINVAAGSTFENTASGTVTLSPGGGNNSYVTGAGSFDNVGTLTAGSGTVHVNITGLPQFSGSTLTGGTWKATGAGTLLNVKYAGRVNVATIGTGARVVLENGGAIDAINAALTTVDGTFIVNGTSTFTDASGFTVGATGLLGGSGTVAAAVTVAGGGTVAPGASPGTLTLQSLTLGEGSVYQWEMAHTWDFDTLEITGPGNSLVLPTQMTFDLRNLGDVAQLTDEFVLFRFAGNAPALPTSLTFLASASPAFLDATAATISLSGNQVLLSGIVAIPEPTALALLGLGALALARRRR